MSRSLLDDIAANPELFQFVHPTDPSEIRALEAELGARLPPSFVEILISHGQGLLFDNESLLGVHELEDGFGEIVGVNRDLRERQSLPPHLIVFHLGLGGLHAFDTTTAGPDYEVVQLDEDSLEQGDEYDGFEAWYEEFLRPEYMKLFDLEDDLGGDPDDDDSLLDDTSDGEEE